MASWFKALAFEPLQYVPSSHKDLIRQKPVLSILAVPHKKATIKTNHWCFYLKTSASSSVCVDCQPTYSIASTVLSGGSKANVVVSDLPSLHSNTAETTFELHVVQGLVVGQVLDALCQHGRHKYEFDSNGVGCRYWITNQIDLLQQLGYTTNPHQSRSAKDGILKFWPDQTPLPLDQGAYYE